MNFILKTLLILILFFSSFYRAQKSIPGIEIKYKYGFLIAHRPIMSHLPKDHTQAFEVNIVYQTMGNKKWHSAYSYPTYGFSFLTTSVGNNKILGQYFGSYAFLQFPFLRWKKNNFNGKIGCGLGYNPKVYDKITNPKNNAISTHFNALINFGLYYNKYFKKSSLQFGIDMSHFSNGSVKLPNLGLNLPYISISYSKYFDELKQNELSKTKTKLQQPWTYFVTLITSFKDYYPVGQKRSQIFALQFVTQKCFRLGLGYEAGVDLLYKPTVKKYKPVIEKSDESIVQTGFYQGYVITLEKLQMVIGMGIYLKDEYFPENRLYHRIGLRYTIKQKFLLNLTLKSHWAKADYLEYGLGYVF
ncbi:MAG: acyloxyacyl hydrolase [Flavobacteriia bacterium]|nr:acyloxyacyl hydrolase [Flavobacteriia bacterium]